MFNRRRQSRRATQPITAHQTDCGTVNIQEPFSSDQVNVVGCPTPSPSSGTLGTTIGLEATVENTNPQAANATVVWTANGRELARSTVTVPANAQATASASFTAQSTGSFSVDADVATANRADVTERQPVAARQRRF